MGDTSDDAVQVDASKSNKISIFDLGDKWTNLITAIVVAVTPIATGINTYMLNSLNQKLTEIQYFQTEIRDSLDKLAEVDSENANIILASLYSLADNYDKKRILISIASSRKTHDLDEAIVYLVLSEDDSKEQAKIINNNPSLREIARRLENKWVLKNYQIRSGSSNPIEQVSANADIRPNITNASAQLMSLYSSDNLEGWILLGRFSSNAHKRLDPSVYGLSLERQLEIINEEESKEDFILPSEGITIQAANVYIPDLKESVFPIRSPIYMRQAPPSRDYDLSMLADSLNTAVLGILCQGDTVKVLEYKPVKPMFGNYTLWGRVSVQSSKPCYSPLNGGITP